MPYGPPPAPYGSPGAFGPPYPYGQQSQYVQPGMLAAAADRERTIDVLKAAYAEGRLTREEFESRSERVLAARTYADLSAIVADLPVGPGGPVAPYYPAGHIASLNSLAVGALISGFIPLVGALPAIVLGHVARSQIRQTGERGDGLAVTGLVFGYFWVAVVLVIMLFALSLLGGHAGP